MPLTLSQRAKAGAIATLCAPLIGALGRTLHWRVEGAGHYDDLMRARQAPIFAFWHGRILPSTLYWRDRGIVVITSENFDGEWIARVIARFGYGTARGSTSRGGARALVQLRQELRAGRPVAFTVDGPRGPARVAQPGAVWLSGATGHPILPFHIEADRCWTARSWDRSQVPKPYSAVAVAIGAPIEVPGTDAGVLESSRLILEQRLEQLAHRAKALLE
jgi:hypothetical protein